MFEKVNPYLKEELNEQAAAHLYGCRCASNTKTVLDIIAYAKTYNRCYASCVIDTNGNASSTEA